MKYSFLVAVLLNAYLFWNEAIATFFVSDAYQFCHPLIAPRLLLVLYASLFAIMAWGLFASLESLRAKRTVLIVGLIVAFPLSPLFGFVYLLADRYHSIRVRKILTVIAACIFGALFIWIIMNHGQLNPCVSDNAPLLREIPAVPKL